MTDTPPEFAIEHMVDTYGPTEIPATFRRAPFDPVLDRIRIRMKADPRTQREIARTIGCTEKHLSRVLRHGDGSFAFLVRLATELGLTITVVRKTPR